MAPLVIRLPGEARPNSHLEFRRSAVAARSLATEKRRPINYACVVYLQLPPPLTNCIIIFAFVLRVEVGEGYGLILSCPDLSKHAGIHVAHQNLTDGIKTVSFRRVSFLEADTVASLAY